MPKTAEGLTLQQQRFVEEYAIDLNATQAAIRAGYSPKTAQEQSSRLLSKAIVADAVAKRVATSTKKADLTIERLDQEIARLAFADLRKLYRDDGSLLPPHEWPDDVAAAVAGVDVAEMWEGRGADRKKIGELRKVKTWDKTTALTLAARRLGLLRDSAEIKVSVSLEMLVAASMKVSTP